MNLPQGPPKRGLHRTDVLNPLVSDVFGEANVETGEAVASGVDDGQHGVVADGVQLEDDDIAQPGEDVLQQPFLLPLQSYPRASTVTVSRGEGRSHVDMKGNDLP